MSPHELSRSGIPDPLAFLHDGEIEVEGRMPWASNATFLVTVRCGDAEQRAIYKPVRGERPLWDFEPGLHRREVAAFRLSETLGIGAVPPTVLRDDGPLGEGSLQWFVDADHSEHYFTIFEHRPDVRDQLRSIAVLDLIANNTDRKSGHVLIDTDDHIWGIDHGLCFAADFKLRTVVWEFGGQAVPGPLLDAVHALLDQMPIELTSLLSDDEAEAMAGRAQWLVDHPSFPVDPTGRRYPWPLV